MLDYQLLNHWEQLEAKWVWECNLEMALILSRPQCVNENTSGENTNLMTAFLLTIMMSSPQNKAEQYNPVHILRNILYLIHQHNHDDDIKWKHFPPYWTFVRGIHRLPVNSPHKGQWRGALMFSLICARIYGWIHTLEADDLRRHRYHYDIIVMLLQRRMSFMASQIRTYSSLSSTASPS